MDAFFGIWHFKKMASFLLDETPLKSTKWDNRNGIEKKNKKKDKNPLD